jgi:hypothetical protein
MEPGAYLPTFVPNFPITNRIKPAHTTPFKIQRNIIHPYTPSSLNHFLLQASPPKFVGISEATHAYHTLLTE